MGSELEGVAAAAADGGGQLGGLMVLDILIVLFVVFVIGIAANNFNLNLLRRRCGQLNRI
jgi:hypothetical protein